MSPPDTARTAPDQDFDRKIEKLRQLFADGPEMHGDIGNEGVDLVGTVHHTRFVIIDNATELRFCTAYNGDWDPYIDHVATKASRASAARRRRTSSRYQVSRLPGVAGSV